MKKKIKVVSVLAIAFTLMLGAVSLTALAESDDVQGQKMEKQAQINQAIEKVENRGKVKLFILGEDYKNLGLLGGEIVQNRDAIRTLIQNLTQAKAKNGKALKAELETLLQEQERLKAVTASREGHFSLFGWLFRWTSGYEAPTEAEEAIDDQLAVDAAAIKIDTTPPFAPGI